MSCSTRADVEPRPRAHRLGPRAHRLGLGALVAILALSLDASAATLTGVSVALDGANSPDLFNDFPATSEIGLSTVALLASDTTSFDTRYALAVGTDIGNAATLTVNHVASYTITFSVSALPAEIWQVDVLSSWLGALTLVNDGRGPASVTLGGVTGTLGGAGTLTGGSLDLAAVGTLAGNAGGDTPFSDSQVAAVQGTGSGTVTLGFTWTSSSTSTRGPSGANRGDEGGLRMGIDSAMSAYTADDYPGVGGRTLADDGHFVSATLTTLVPEPPLLALVLFAAGFALAGRRRRRAALGPAAR